MPEEAKGSKLVATFNRVYQEKVLSYFSGKGLAFTGCSLRVGGVDYQETLARFSLLLQNYHDQGLIKRVCESTKLANAMVTIPATEAFIHPSLDDKKHADLAQIETCIRNAAIFMGIVICPNEGYRLIRDGIYISINIVLKEKEAEDRETEKHKAQR